MRCVRKQKSYEPTSTGYTGTKHSGTGGVSTYNSAGAASGGGDGYARLVMTGGARAHRG